MNKLAKTLLIVIVAIAALLIAAVAVIVATFDPATYKPLLIERVQKDWQRTLAVPGAVSLSFFPKIGVQTGELSLSERGGNAPFASAQSARVSLALWPLLRQQVVVDRIQINGLRASIVRHADGRTSIDDLLGAPADGDKAAPAAGSSMRRAAPAFDIAGLGMRDAALTIDDRASRRRIQISGIQVETGRLATGVPGDVSVQGRVNVDQPAVAVDWALKGRLRVDPAQQRHGVDGLALSVTGLLAGQKGVSLALGGAIDADMKVRQIGFSGLTLDASLPRAGAEPLRLQAKGSAKAELSREVFDAQLAGTLDGANFDARLGLTRFTPAAMTFDVKVDRLDADRYAGKSNTAPAAGGSGDAPLDLSGLRALDARGQLRIGAFTVAKMKAEDVQIGVRASGGRVDLAPLSARFYEGKLEGTGQLDARGNSPRVALRQTLSGVQIGSMLKDAMGRDAVEGRGEVRFDVWGQGRSVSAMTKSLAGSANVALRDGAVRGVNVSQVIRSAKAKIGGGSGEQTGAGSSDDKTDFSEMTASFRIDRGVARNDDLLVKSPLLRITGKGDVDLGAQRIDYVVKATVVATLEGQGGPELKALSGQTVPVHLSGPFDAIGWRIDFGAMALDAVKAKIEKPKEEAEKQLREKLGEKLKGLFGR